MDITEIAGFIGAGIIGITLGLIGGGGSILTVPVLVYILSVDPVLATAYSLFVVGTTALVGAIRNMFKGFVDYKTAVVFSLPAFISVYITRKYVIPAIPEELFSVGNLVITKDISIMVFFAIIMLLAATSMIRNNGKKIKAEIPEGKKKLNIPVIALEGILVGAVTGIVGAGGGFLIIPALVILARLPMKTAIGTSLLIIAVKSLIGFVGDLQTDQDIDWQFLSLFSGISVVGIFIGTWLTKYFSGQNLKQGFGWFVLIMGLFIIIKELFLDV